MAIGLTSFCVVLLFVSSGCSQRLNVRQPPLQNMIDYTSQFVSQQQNAAPPQEDPVETSKLEDDPLIKNLFQEFLVQYQQLANEQKTEAPTTSTTTQNPLFPDFSTLYTSAPLHPASPFISATTPSPAKRRLSPRRKISIPVAARGTSNNVISSTTPLSTLFNRVNSLHHETAESTTAFSSLKQRFFGVESSSKPKKTSPVEPKRFPFLVRTTPAPQLEIEELPSTTPSPKPLPNVKIPPRLVNIPSKPQAPSFPMETTTKKEVASEFDEKEFRRQAESAKYEFASDIDDEINGNLHQREEVRDGLTVRGRYSFSDGYFKRTVHYEADDKGYRVTKEEVQPLEGPQTNPDGHARVSSYVAGNAVNYQITKDDILERNQKTIFHTPEDEVAIDQTQEI